MKIEHLQLRDFQSYASTDLDFDEGLTLIHGSNGAGKSTLLRAIFGGLFQTNAIKEASSDYSLADLVARGEDEGAVLLTVSAGGTMYTVEWIISVTEDDDGERKGSTESCSLTSPELDNPVEGVRAVRSFVTDLIGMGSREFANSVYVQQKRFSRLIEANGSDRKEILDGLLGLNELDKYIDRTKRARRPVKRQRDDYQARLQEVRERIAEYDEDSLLNERQRIDNNIDEQREELEATREVTKDVSQKLDSIKEDIEEYEDRIQRRDELKEAIDEKNDTIETIRGDIEDAKEHIEEQQQRVEELEEDIEDAEVDKYDISTPEAAEEALDQVRADRDDAYESEQTTQMNVQTAQGDLEDAKQSVNEAKKELKESEQQLDEAKQMIRQRLSAINVSIGDEEAVEDAVRRTADNWAETVDEVTVSDTTVDAVEEATEELADRYEELSDRVAQQQATEKAIQNDIQSAEEEISDLDDKYERVLEVLDTDEETEPMKAYDEAMSEARSLADTVDIDVDDGDILTVMENRLRAAADNLVDEYHELAVQDATTDELEAYRDELRTVHKLTTALAKALQYEELAEVEEELQNARNELHSLQERKDDVSENLTETRELKQDVENQRDKGEALATIMEHLDKVEEQREAVEEAEGDVEAAEEAVKEAQDNVEEAEEAKQEAEEKLSAIEETRDRVSSVVEKYDDIADAKQSIENHRNTIGQCNERIQDLNDAIAADKERLNETEEKLASYDMGELEDKKQELQGVATKGEKKHEAAEAELNELRDELASVNQNLKALENEREREENLQNKSDEYNDLASELTELIEMYKSVKVDLREETLGLLNQYTNDVFKDLYENESYVGVTVDTNYNVRLVTGDGEEIDPDKCSGGEGVITNIALRAGVYRVIAEQDESGGDTLPPFILDEPTNHLDDEHVSRIEDAIKSIQEWNVPQVFVVSHRESLVTSADHELYAEKDKATGNSSARFKDD